MPKQLRIAELDVSPHVGDTVRSNDDGLEYLVDRVDHDVRWEDEHGSTGWGDRITMTRNRNWPAGPLTRTVFDDEVAFIRGTRYVKAWQLRRKVRGRALQPSS